MIRKKANHKNFVIEDQGLQFTKHLTNTLIDKQAHFLNRAHIILVLSIPSLGYNLADIACLNQVKPPPNRTNPFKSIKSHSQTHQMNINTKLSP